MSKAEAKVRTRVLGLGVPSAPTVKDVLQVGRPRQEGPPPPKDGTWVRQELQIQQQRTVVEGVGATYHARAGRAALAAVESLHAREEQAGEYLVGDYVDRFAQLHGAYHDAGQALEAALGLVETRQAALAHAGQALAEAAAVREELGACLPPLEAAHRRCEEELQGAREALHAAGTVPELELGLAQARDEHGHLQRLAGEIAARRREIRMQAGPQQKLMGHEAASSRLQLAASGERLARLESDLARARSAQSEVARLEQRAGEAAGHLADAKKDLDNLDLHCQYLKEPQQALQQAAEAAQSSREAAQKRFDAAAQALRQHQQAVHGVESALRPGQDIERSLAAAREAQARLDGKLQGVQDQLDATRKTASEAARTSMRSMRMNPPGFAGAPALGAALRKTLAALVAGAKDGTPDPDLDAALRDTLATLEAHAALRQTLATLGDRLLAVPPQKGNLAADEILELAIRSAAHASGGNPAVAAIEANLDLVNGDIYTVFARDAAGGGTPLGLVVVDETT